MSHLIKSIQGGPSGHGTQFFDIKLKVMPQYKLLVLKCYPYCNANKSLYSTRWTTLYNISNSWPAHEGGGASACAECWQGFVECLGWTKIWIAPFGWHILALRDARPGVQWRGSVDMSAQHSQDIWRGNHVIFVRPGPSRSFNHLQCKFADYTVCRVVVRTKTLQGDLSGWFPAFVDSKLNVA